MAYIISEARIVPQAIAETSTTQYHPLGTEVRAKDSTYGAGTFVYLLGAANTVVGSLVLYNATTWQTVLADNTKYQAAPLAVAMSANVEGQYGWYQIVGAAVVKKTAVKFTAQVPAYLSATAGRVKSTASVGTQILGARSANLATVTSTTSTVVLMINRPFAQGADNVTTSGA